MKSIDSSANVMVSIILTVYNHEKYLARALDSILLQKVNFRFEVVIGDDASTDSSSSIVSDYANRFPGIFVPVYRISNVGGVKNFTDLFRRCRGKYLTFIDGDDYWIDGNKLQVQYDYLESHPEVFSISHKVRICDSDGNSIGMVPPATFTHGQMTPKQFLSGNRFALSATMMRGVSSEETEGLLKLVEAGPRNAGDFTICMFLLNRGSIPILATPMSIYNYRSKANDTNYNSITKTSKRIRDRILLINNNVQFYSGKHYFGWMYIRLAGSAARGLFYSKPIEFIKLAYLIMKIGMLLIESTFRYLFHTLDRRQASRSS